MFYNGLIYRLRKNILRWVFSLPEDFWLASGELSWAGGDDLRIEDRRALNLLSPRAVEHISSDVVGVGDDAGDFARRLAREVRIGEVLEMAHVLRFVVDDVHLADVVDPQLAHDDVANERTHFAPCVVMPALLELQVRRA